MTRLVLLLLSMIIACTGKDESIKEPFRASSHETYWTFDVLLEEKYKEAEDIPEPVDSLMEEQPPILLDPEEAHIHEGKGYLRQLDSFVEGYIQVDSSMLRLEGEIKIHKNETVYLSISYEGQIIGETVYGNAMGTVESDNINGTFMKIVQEDGTLVSGNFGFSNIFKQEVPQPPIQGQEQPRDPCGNKISEQTHILRSPATGQITRVKIEWFERCLKATFVDENGDQLDGTNIFTLNEDLKKELNGDTVKVFDAAINGKKTTTKPDGDDADPDSDDVIKLGEIKYISVSGCNEIKYYQYVDEYLKSKTIRGKLGARNTIKDLRADGNQPNLGWPPMPNVGEGRPLGDIPGYPVEELPFDEGSLQNIPDFSEIHHFHKYLTYICCDNQLLGVVLWGYKVVYTIVDESVDSKIVKKIKPKWYGPDRGTPKEDEVKKQCQGN